MAYSTLSTQADTPTAGPNAAYMQQVADNFDAIRTDRVGAIIRKTGTQTITPILTLVPITFDVEDIDHGGCANLGTDNTKITVPASKGGRWAIGGTLDFHVTNNGIQAALTGLLINGTTVYGEDETAGGTVTPGPNKACFGTTLTLAAADYIQMWAYHGTVATQVVQNTEVFATLWAWRLSS